MSELVTIGHGGGDNYQKIDYYARRKVKAAKPGTTYYICGLVNKAGEVLATMLSIKYRTPAVWVEFEVFSGDKTAKNTVSQDELFTALVEGEEGELWRNPLEGLLSAKIKELASAVGLEYVDKIPDMPITNLFGVPTEL